jgi:transcriptional regulator with XRE-family HTH domain
MTYTPSTGISGLDDLIDGLRSGDNVVWSSKREVWSLLLRPFAEKAETPGLCYVAVDAPPQDLLSRYRIDAGIDRFVVVDLHTGGLAGKVRKRKKSAYVEGAYIRTAADSRDFNSVQSLMKEIEDELGSGTRYVFESLTGLQKLWDADSALSFFLRHCPRLYDLRTVAYWMLDPLAHEQGFLRRVHDVTQVVLEVFEGKERAIRVSKADARSADVMGRVARLVIGDNDVPRVVTDAESARSASGEVLRRRRSERGLSQSELARRIGVTPSALSQAEKGKRPLSHRTMKTAWRELGIDVDGDEDEVESTYVIARRGARFLSSVVAGVEGEKVMSQPSGFEVQRLAFAPGASGRRPPVLTKRPEFVMVTEGVLQLRVGESREVLHAGDAMLIGTQPVSGWRNPGPTVARATWIVLPDLPTAPGTRISARTLSGATQGSSRRQSGD